MSNLHRPLVKGLVQEWSPLGVGRVEDMWLSKAQMHFGFVAGSADLLPAYELKEFFRPAQVDSAGNFNNIAFGSDYFHPRMRLPGTGGIPDVTTFSNKIHLYVPRHSRVTFVEKLDFVSGLGHSPQRKRGAGVRYLVTDLGQFDWLSGRMRLTQFHPGVTVEQVQKKTGFPLEIAGDVSETAAPTPEEVHLLRENIDPLGVRKLEMLGGSARKELLTQILTAENAL